MAFIGTFMVLMVWYRVSDSNQSIVSAWQWSGSRYWIVLAVSLLRLVLVLAGSVLLLVPGLYLAVRYSQAPISAAFEGGSIADAFRRSSQLTLGRRWAIAGRLLSLGVICAVSAIGFILFFLGLLTILRVPHTTILQQILIPIGAGIAAILIEVPLIAWSYELYLALK